MAGAEEIFARAPRFSENEFHPDSALTAQILAQGAQGQQQRLDKYADLRAQGAGIPFDALSNAADKFVQGRQLARAEESQDLKNEGMRRANEQYALSNEGLRTKNDADRLALSEEQTKHNFMFTPDPVTHKTRAEEQFNAELENQKLQPQLTKEQIASSQQGRDLASKKFDLDKRVTESQLRLNGMLTGNAIEDRMRTNYSATVKGIMLDGSLTPQQKDEKIAALTSPSGIYGKLDPNAAAGMKGMASNEALAIQRAASASGELTTENMHTYADMHNVSQNTLNNVNALKSLQNLKAQYMSGTTAGWSNAAAEAARNQFANALERLPNMQGAGERIRSTSITSVPQRMDEMIRAAYSAVKDEHENTLGNVVPEMTKRPEFEQSEQAYNALASQFSDPNDRTPRGFDDPSPGQDPNSLLGKLKAPRVQGQGMAPAAPAGASQPPPSGSMNYLQIPGAQPNMPPPPGGQR